MAAQQAQAAGAAVMANDSSEMPVRPGEEPPPSPRRRRLLKALAAAAPVVLTLRSGAEAALRSDATRCITTAGYPTFVGMDGPRCAPDTALAAINANNYMMVLETSSHFGGGGDDINGNTTTDGDVYCAIYVDSSGLRASAPNYGGSSGSNSTPDNAGGYYAVTKSCWGSFEGTGYGG
ncbi:MAG: hypothetical protein HQL51_04220 [Magnetococcales bacterium]|nr:hypothetical protein [Magnetococcales bacterium]